MKKHIFIILSLGVLVLLYGCSSEYKKENHLRSENVLIEKAIDSFRKNDYVDSMRLTQKLKSMKAKVINEYSKMYLFAIGGDLWYKPFDINSIAKKIPYPTELRETFVEIPILIRVDINGSPDVSIKYNKKIDENAIEYKFFTYFKKHLEKFKIDPTYDLVKHEAVSYNYSFILRFVAPDTISLEKEPHMKPDIFKAEVFNSLPEIMSCSKGNDISVLSFFISSVEKTESIKVQTNEVCDKIDLDVQKSLNALEKNNDGKRVVIGKPSCIPSTVKDEKTIECVKKILKKKMQFFPDKARGTYHFYLSSDLKDELF